jgi:hypothetical protein
LTSKGIFSDEPGDLRLRQSSRRESANSRGL